MRTRTRNRSIGRSAFLALVLVCTTHQGELSGAPVGGEDVVARIAEIERLAGEDIGDRRGIAPLVVEAAGGLLGAAKSLAEHRSPSVAIITGFYTPYAEPPACETDGPPGAAHLALAFHNAGIPCRIATDMLNEPVVLACLWGASLPADLPVDTICNRSGDGGRPLAEVIEAWRNAEPPITHVIAIERCGPAADGKPHNFAGDDITEWNAPLHELYEAGNWTKIGIGDGGNEIGMGSLPRGLVTSNVRNGETVASVTRSDHLMVCGTSNWGGWALPVSIALLRPDLSDRLVSGVNPQTDLAILQAAVRKGRAAALESFDSKRAYPTMNVDALPWEVHARKLTDILAAAGLGDAAAPAAENEDDLVEKLSKQVSDRYAGIGRRALADCRIGVFDSGTGGLTVMEQILLADRVGRTAGGITEGPDGVPDFAGEEFVFLGDEANMPYGNYAPLGRQRFLENLILMDAAFLLSGSNAGTTEAPHRGPVKAIVIACNTATAYGQDDIERLLERSGVDVPVIGVVGAGARGALDALGDDDRGVIGTLSTVGTAESGAYARAVAAESKRRGRGAGVPVVEGGAFGLAGAIEESPEYIATDARGVRPDYRGPALGHDKFPIDWAHRQRYAFNRGTELLVEGDPDTPTAVQLNSVANYVKYHVVALAEQVREGSWDRPRKLSAVILGCTHFPYIGDTIKAELMRLRDHKEDGHHRYRDFIDADVVLVDPAQGAAAELFTALRSKGTLDDDYRSQPDLSVYLSLPKPGAGSVSEGPSGAYFDYDYKYGREAAYGFDDYHFLPVPASSLDASTAARLKQRLPATWRTMTRDN